MADATASEICECRWYLALLSRLKRILRVMRRVPSHCGRAGSFFTESCATASTFRRYSLLSRGIEHSVDGKVSETS